MSRWHLKRKSSEYGERWRRIRKVVLARDFHLCVLCKDEGRLVAGTEVDHIIPKSDGGTDAIDNLQTLCTTHHASKTARESQGRTAIVGCDASGMPRDQGHPWSVALAKTNEE